MEINEKMVEFARNLEMLESIAKAKMSKEARARYSNLKLAHQDLAIKAIALIAEAVQLKQIEHVDEEQFKSVLQQLNTKKEFKFKK